MGMSQWPLWRAGVFRNIKGIFESPKRVVPVVRISEAGVVTRESLPMATGFMSDTINRQTWIVVHPLKIWLEGEAEQVQLISERSYYPLDPFGRFTEEAKSRVKSLKEIAIMRHAEKRAQVIQDNKQNPYGSLLQNITTWCFVIDAICLAIYFFTK